MNQSAIRFVSMFRSNPDLRAALQNNTAFVVAINLREAALRQQGNLPAVQRPPVPDASEESITAWVDGQLAANSGDAQRTARHHALTELIGIADGQITTSVDVDDVLQHLHANLETLFAEIDSTVDRLDGARTPGEAITAGTADAWQELIQHRRKYDSLRSSQRLVMHGEPAADMARADYLDDDIGNDMMLANLDTLMPGWRLPPPKSVDALNPLDLRPWPLDDPVAELIWIVTSEAQPWIPTRRQLAKLRAQRADDANPDGRPPHVMPERLKWHDVEVINDNARATR